MIARGGKTLPLYQRVAEAHAARAIVLPATEGQPLQVLLLSCVTVSLEAALKVYRQRQSLSCLRLRGSPSRGLLRQHVLCPGEGSAHDVPAQAALLPHQALRGSHCCCADHARRLLIQATLTIRHA